MLTPEEERSLAERERYLSEVIDASDRAIMAVQTILAGGSPDLDALEAGAAVLTDFARGKVTGPHPITEDDVAAARHLVDLVRRQAPKDEIATAARRLHGILSPASFHDATSKGR